MSAPYDKPKCTRCRAVNVATPKATLCDGCWELERRIQAQPELARQILFEADQAQLTALIAKEAR